MSPRVVTEAAEDSWRSRRSQGAGEVSGHGPLEDKHSPVTGRPPSYLGGSQTRTAQSSPTEVTRTASGGSGTSGGAGGPGRMVRGPLGALGDHPLAQPPGPPHLPTTFRRMEATSSPAGLVTLMV